MSGFEKIETGLDANDLNTVDNPKRKINKSTLENLTDFFKKDNHTTNEKDDTDHKTESKTEERFAKNCEEMNISKEDTDKIKNKNGTENKDGSYTDRNGNNFPSFKDWFNTQCANIKRAESTAETYKKKADAEYSNYKNSDMPSEKKDAYLKSQQDYERSKKAEQAASDIKNKLEVPKTRLPESNGQWTGEPGNSKFIPDGDYTPPEKSRNPENPYSNPENKTWNEILDKYDIDGIDFKDGFPDFSKVAEATVEIEDFETGGTKAKDNNFTKADIELAAQRGCTPEEIRNERKENNYTWHECEDKKTMLLVPNEVHANIPHNGGRSQ